MSRKSRSRSSGKLSRAKSSPQKQVSRPEDLRRVKSAPAKIESIEFKCKDLEDINVFFQHLDLLIGGGNPTPIELRDKDIDTIISETIKEEKSKMTVKKLKKLIIKVFNSVKKGGSAKKDIETQIKELEDRINFNNTRIEECCSFRKRSPQGSRSVSPGSPGWDDDDIFEPERPSDFSVENSDIQSYIDDRLEEILTQQNNNETKLKKTIKTIGKVILVAGIAFAITWLAPKILILLGLNIKPVAAGTALIVSTSAGFAQGLSKISENSVQYLATKLSRLPNKITEIRAKRKNRKEEDRMEFFDSDSLVTNSSIGNPLTDGLLDVLGTGKNKTKRKTRRKKMTKHKKKGKKNRKQGTRSKN